MKATLEFILLTQSPALFLAAIVLLIAYFIKKKKHRIRAALNLIGTVVCFAGGVVLYFAGIKLNHFTIDDFWQIRIPGWVGLGIVVVLTGLSIYRSTAKAITKRRADKYAAKAETELSRSPSVKFRTVLWPAVSLPENSCTRDGSSTGAHSITPCKTAMAISAAAANISLTVLLFIAQYQKKYSSIKILHINAM